jgi:peptidoglycan/xylan/chitin deacetylase (PgdA/CDA1 family)
MRVILMRMAGLLALVLVGGLVAYGMGHAPKMAAPASAPVKKVAETRRPPANPIREIPQEPVQVATASPVVPMPSFAEPPPAPTQPPAASEPVMAQAPAPAPAAAPTPAPVAPPAPAPAPAAAPPPTPIANCPGNPNALGVTRVVEVDTTGGPGFGAEHFKGMDFLKPGEVVLTFDDGPWPNNTPKVLAALARHCTKAIFFPIGIHATYEPDLLKQVAAAGHAVGSHTWCHQNLAKTKGSCLLNGRRQTVEYNFKDEIEKGISAVSWALGGPISPFFRFPALQQPPEAISYLGQRNVGIFSTDFDSFDFKMRRPEQVRKSVMEKLKKHGKGIILMHDFQHATADAISQILDDLKAGGYRVVQMKGRDPLAPLPEYDAMIMKEIKTPNVSGRPVESVVRTIEGQ